MFLYTASVTTLYFIIKATHQLPVSLLGMAVQASDVRQDVLCHGQHQLDVRGRAASAQQNHGVCI